MGYSGSSYLADEVLEDLSPLPNGNFSDSCSDCSYFILTQRAQHLADQVLADHPPLQMAFSSHSCSTLRVHIWQTKCWEIYPSPIKGNFTDSCSDCSYFFPTLRAQHLAGQGLAHLTPLSNGNFTDSWATLGAHIWQTKCWEIYPHLNGNFTDSLLWLLIFLSYCKSSTFGRPGLGTSIPLSNGNFTDSCSDCSYFITYSESSTFGRPGLGRSPPLQMSIFTHSCSTLRVHIWQTKCWEIYPSPLKGNFTDSCSDCPQFFPTLRAQHLADQVLADLTPLSNGSFTDSCSDCSYFFPTLRVQHFAGHLFADLPPFKWHFHRFLFYSESSTFGRPGLGTCTPLSNGNFTDSLLWLLIFLSYCKSSTFGRPGLGTSIPLSNGNFTDSCSDSGSSYLEDEVLEDLLPLQMAISAIPALTVYILFLFRSSTFGRLVLEHPPFKGQFHIFLPYSESSYLADQVLGNLPSLSNGNFTDSCSDCSYFFPTLRAQHLADHGHGTSTPLSNGNFTDSCSDCSYFFPTLRAQHFAGHDLCRSTPLSNGYFHRYLLWLLIFLSYSKSSYLADEVLTDLPPFKWQFYRFLLYSKSSYLADQVLTDLSIFPNGNFTDSFSDCSYFLSYSESSTFGRPDLGRSIPISNGNFTDSCPDCLYFILIQELNIWKTEVLEDLPPLQMAISQQFLLWLFIFYSYSGAQHLAD